MPLPSVTGGRNTECVWGRRRPGMNYLRVHRFPTTVQHFDPFILCGSRSILLLVHPLRSLHRFSAGFRRCVLFHNSSLYAKGFDPHGCRFADTSRSQKNTLAFSCGLPTDGGGRSLGLVPVSTPPWFSSANQKKWGDVILGRSRVGDAASQSTIQRKDESLQCS